MKITGITVNIDAIGVITARAVVQTDTQRTATMVCIPVSDQYENWTSHKFTIITSNELRSTVGLWDTLDDVVEDSMLKAITSLYMFNYNQEKGDGVEKV
jgi:hypothetical protein